MGELFRAHLFVDLIQIVHSWLYRLRPSSVHHTPMRHYPHDRVVAAYDASITPVEISSSSKSSSKLNDVVTTPQQLRWRPLPLPTDVGKAHDFVDGLVSFCGAGSPNLRNGLSIYMYTANISMTKRALYNADGDFLIVPQLGILSVHTEFGKISVAPNEICVIPRGIRFSIILQDETAACRGYVLEVFNGAFELPDLGPIGTCPLYLLWRDFSDC